MSALLHRLPPHERDIGFPVKRLLPAGVAQTVGPFIFFDHLGPATFAIGTTQEDVRPHPHIGLSTFTYLFSGALMHRDSLGVAQRIEPGAVNGMTAGRGAALGRRHDFGRRPRPRGRRLDRGLAGIDVIRVPPTR